MKDSLSSSVSSPLLSSSTDAMENPSSRLYLSPQAWIDYIPNYISVDKATILMNSLIKSEEWEHRSIAVFGKEVKQPRLMSWGGALPYRYSGQTLPIRPIPQALNEIWRELEKRYQQTFNHVVLNYYRDGKDHMGMHADDERELGVNPLIVALSLGESRAFNLEIKQRRRGRKKHKKQLNLSIEHKTDDRTQFPLGKKYQLILEHGSLMTMGGNLQHQWRHGVPKIKGNRECGPRLNITFRFLLGHPGEVPRKEHKPFLN